MPSTEDVIAFIVLVALGALIGVLAAKGETVSEKRKQSKN